ncbi:PREDICTED: uncharacterized protein CXorf21 homolog, partial [Nanorana parkeri]|uniref:uncharacterized protein CXorf21 homolog n=1 Tax=Nanorana parkeri TaxID=125878 RepID=UPI000854CABC
VEQAIIMLSEAFLSTIMYEKEIGDSSWQGRSHDQRVSRKCPRPVEPHCGVISSEGGACDCGEKGHCNEWGSVASPSQAMTIPSRDLAICSSPDLYTSWSSMYTSIYKNYPDLHIAGDHILNKKDSGCVLECEDGPVLLSVDIDSSSPPTGLLEGPPEEGVLRSEDSNVFPSAPFSNSILNGFIEKKMQELYKQCYEETLVTKGSPNPGWLNFLLANLNQMSLMVSQGQNMDRARAREAILQYLYSATSGGSSEFITPILHISTQDFKRKSSTFSKQLRP